MKRDLNLQCFYTRHWLSFPFPPNNLVFQSLWCDSAHTLKFIGLFLPIPFAAQMLRSSFRSTCLYIAKALSWWRFSWKKTKPNVSYWYIHMYHHQLNDTMSIISLSHSAILCFVSIHFIVHVHGIYNVKVNGCWKQNANSSWWWINCINYWYMKLFLIQN